MGMYLGVDVGGTASRWVLMDHLGAIVERGEASGSTGLIDDVGNLAQFQAMLAMVRAALPVPAERAHFGITGVGFKYNAAAVEQISLHLGLPINAITCTNDTVLSWRAAFPDKKGHLVNAGTGSVGLSYDAQGELVVVGGRGALVDDGGSGAWIALQALRLLYRLIDREGHPGGQETLADAVFSVMGGDDQDALRRFVYGGDRGRIGSLAIAVAKAAALGDATARDLMYQAGLELVQLAKLLMRRCGVAPIAFVGRVPSLSPIVRDTIVDNLPQTTVLFPKIDPALQAARIALEQARA